MGILILVFASCKVRYDISPYTQKKGKTYNPREKQGQRCKPVDLVKQKKQADVQDLTCQNPIGPM